MIVVDQRKGFILHRAWQLLKTSFRHFTAGHAGRLAAALSYYAIFSVAPLLVILLGLTGAFLGAGEARDQVLGYVQQQTGSEIAGLIQGLIDSTVAGSYQFATVIGTVILLFAATGFFTQLQGALNVIWNVRETRFKGLAQHAFMRLRALGIMLVLAVIVLLAVAMQAVSAALGRALREQWPQVDLWLLLGSQLVAVIVLALAFAAIMKVLTHSRVRWSALFAGALLTALLFRIGQVFIGLYLSTSAVGSAFGAAGSVVVLLLFVNFSMQIFLFGAAFTRAWQDGSEGAEPQVLRADTPP